MNYRHIAATAATGIAFSVIAAANAQAAVTFSTVDLNPTAAVTGATYTDFGTGGEIVSGSFVLSNANGGAVSFAGDGAVVSGNVAGAYAQPALTSGNYLAVGFNGPSELVSLTGLHDYVGLYWGSMDSYNSVSLYLGNTLVGTLSGDQVATPADGNQLAGATNKYVNISSSELFDRIGFVSSSPAFELDNLALTAAITPAIPEPASWALILVGFLSLGFLGCGHSQARFRWFG